MADDIASIGVKMDTSGVEGGIKSLEALAQQGPKVEKALDSVEKTAAKAGKSLKSIGEGAGKGLEEVGRTAPKAADGVGRVAKSAEDARRALAGINTSVASLGQVSTAATQSARGMASFSASIQASQKSLVDMQAQVRAASTAVAQMGSILTSALPSMQAAAKAQMDAAKSAADMGSAFKTASDQVRAYSTVSARASEASQKTAKSMDATAVAARTLGSALAVAGVGFGAQELIAMVDGYTKYTAQLKLATKSTTDHAIAMSSVKRIATDAQQGLGEVGTLYARIANGTNELGLSQKKLADITEAVALSLKVNGAGASESASAMLQLSQAFGSGRLAGEEFNAVNEAAPGLLRDLATAMGVPVGALRAMASEGKLTSAVLAENLPKALGKLREQAKEVQTISGAFTVLKNNIMEMVGAQSNASGTTKALASGIGGLANNLDLVAAAGAAVAVVIGARLTASVAASGVAFAASAVQAARYQATLAGMAGVSSTAAAGLVTMGAAARGASAAMAFVGGPIGAVVAVAGLAATAFYAFGSSAGELTKSIGGLSQPLDDLKRKLDALPPEKRISIILDIKEEAAKKAKEAESSFDDLAASMVGAFSYAGSSSAESARQVNKLVEQLDNAKKTGEDMTPILRDAARSAGVSNATLKTWLDLAANMRAAREAAKTGEQVPDVTGAVGGRGSINPPTVGEISATARGQAKAALDATKAYQSQAEQMTKVREEGATLRAALKALEQSNEGAGASAVQLRERLKGVDERLTSIAKRGHESTAGLKAAENSYQSLLKSVHERIAATQLEMSQASKLTDGQKLQIKYDELLATGKKGVSEALKVQIQGQITYLAGLEKEQKAIKQMTAAYLLQHEMQEEISADYAKRSNALGQARQAMDAYEQSARQDFDRLELEAGLIGASNQMRAVALAQYDAELELKRKIAEIDAMDTVNGESDREELRVRARAVAVKKVAIAERKAYVTEWEKTSQLIGDTLADFIMSGGDDAATYLKRLFATLVLQPTVQTGIGALMGSAQPAASAASGGMNLLGGLQSGQSLWSAFSGGTSGALASGVSGLGSLMGSSFLGELGAGIAAGGQLGIGGTASLMGAAGGTTGVGMALGAAAPWLAGAAALFSIIKSMDDSGTPHTGAGAVYSKSTGLQGGADIYGRGTFGMGHRDEYNAQMQAGISGIAQGLGQTLDAFAVSFGKTAGYSVATAFADDSSKDGAWGSLKIADELGKVLVNWEDSRSSKWAPREFADGEEGYKQYLAAVATDVKGAFLAMDLPAWADQILETANDIDTLNTALAQIGTVKAVFDGLGQTMAMFSDLGGEAQTALLNVAGGIDALSSVAGGYYQAIYTEQERLAQARAQMEATLAGFGATVPATREQYRALVEQQIAAGEAGAKFAVVLMGLAGVFGSVVDSIDAEFAGLADSVKGVFEPLIGSIGDLRSEVAATIAQIKRGTEAMTAEEIRAAIAGVAGIGAPGTAGVDAAGAGVASAAARLAARQAANDAAQALAQGKLGGLQSATVKRDGVLSEQERLQGVISTAKSEHARFEDGGDLRNYSYNTRVTWMSHWAAEMQKAQQQLDALSPSLAAYNAEVAAQQAAYNAVQGAAQGPAEQLAAAQAALVAAQQAEVKAKADYAKEVNAFVASAGASVVKLGDLREEVVQYYEAQAQAVQSMIATAEQLRDVVGSIRMGQLDSAQTVAQLSGSYASDYSMALATTGAVRAGYAESMGATLPALADAMKTEAATSADWRVQTAKLLAQATNISGMLDAEAEASDYQDVALGLLGSIDEALLKLDTGTKSAEQVIAQAIENGTSAQLAGLRAIVAALQGETIPAFASGGMHMGGLRLVGERGPELEATGPSRIWNAQQTRALMGGEGGGDNAALVAEVRGLREDNRALQEAMVRQQADMNSLLMRWETQGMPEERVV